ncbi:phosphatase inhibitor-domain-containing protein [Phycomyces blakesleeanus]
MAIEGQYNTNNGGSSTRMRDNLAGPSHGSRTLTVEETYESDQDNVASNGSEEEVGVLRLRGDMTVRRPRAIQWDENVVDNEHLGRKKSKICCIYHRPRAVGESSDSESSSDSGSGSSSGESSNNDRARPCNHSHHRRNKKKNPRQVSPNAYEKQPVYKDRPQPPSS